MSVKNQLQEFVQGKGWRLPFYKTVPVAGDAPHEQRYDATVTVDTGDNQREFTVRGRSKRDAEKAAADKALAFFAGFDPFINEAKSSGAEATQQAVVAGLSSVYELVKQVRAVLQR